MVPINKIRSNIIIYKIDIYQDKQKIHNVDLWLYSLIKDNSLFLKKKRKIKCTHLFRNRKKINRPIDNEEAAWKMLQ